MNQTIRPLLMFQGQAAEAAKSLASPVSTLQTDADDAASHGPASATTRARVSAT